MKKTKKSLVKKGLDEIAHKELQEALEKFKQQFDLELESTGHIMEASENGKIQEEEYWVKGLVESKVDGLNFEVGGWFSNDMRKNGNIYCLL